MTTELVTTSSTTALAPAFERIKSLVLDTVSGHSQRAYGRALNDFLVWYVRTGQTVLNKATVQAHIADLKATGVSASSINQRLAAIRKLAAEAADNELIPESTAQGIRRIENIKIQGKKLGNWLTRTQASAMLNAPDTDTLKGLRDRAILALLLGCGLRREEVAALTVEHLQQRDGRWVILDLKGKHNRTRTVPIAAWVKSLIDKWLDAVGIKQGYVFRQVRKGGHVTDTPITAHVVWNVVQDYSPVEGLAPHDLRRTFAKLADKEGAPLAQIQKTLGHASVQTTERYIGSDLDLDKAPSDYIKLDIAK